MRIRHTVLATMLVLPPTLVVGAPSYAAPTCKGHSATIVGTSGNDTRIGTPLRDVVVLGAGNDSFTGLGGDDIVCGGAGKDRLAGGEGNDRILGERGRDYVVEDAGNDVVDGGGSRDYLSYYTWSGSIRVTDGRVVDGAGHDVTRSIETIEGTPYADTMRGGRGDDDLRGLTGNDRVSGGAGNDYLTATAGVIRAGAGSDYVYASGQVTAYLGRGVNGAQIGPGAVTVVGGPDQDEFSIQSRATRSRVRGGGNNNQIVFLGVRRSVTADIGKGAASWKGGHLRFAGVHTLIGTRRKDLLIGSATSDILYGRAGADLLRGAGGNDIVTGQAGQDAANGGSGLDYCFAERRVACEG
jgi:Ca2+-binding RTX toxin-like protein